MVRMVAVPSSTEASDVHPSDAMHDDEIPT